MTVAVEDFTVEPVCDRFGARIHGLDLSRPLADATFDAILAAWQEHPVLIFPGQTLTNRQHIGFSRRFGPLDVHPSRKYVLKDDPEILLLTNRRDAAGNYISLRDGGSVWHSDLSYMAEPSLGSLLYAIDVPRDGGDTEWANMYDAYDRLPASLKARIEGLRAVHQFDQKENPRLGPPPGMTDDQKKGSIWETKSAAVKARTPDAVHPVVRTHAGTGRRALFVNRRFTTRIVDMEPAEGEALLLELFSYAEDPEIVYRHRWRKGDFVMWDNRCTIHLACGGVPDDQLRTMQRTTIRGEVPV